MSNFTQGPWKSVDNLALSISGVSIAECWYHGKDEETHANARLIAAAPDMYEALQEFCAWVEVSNAYGKIKLDPRSQAYVKGKSALDKAEGKVE